MISTDKRAHIVRLFSVEKWRISTIARQLGIHHSAVERVLREQEGEPRRVSLPGRLALLSSDGRAFALCPQGPGDRVGQVKRQVWVAQVG